MEQAYLQVRSENSLLKERLNELNNTNQLSKNESKERKRLEMREDQARRELEHVKREKEKIVD